MKRFLFAIFASLALCSLVNAQEDTTRVTEWEDTVIEKIEDRPTLLVDGEDLSFMTDSFWGMTTGIVAITFAFPIIIVFIAFYFQYRSRKQKYKLIEKALESGQPLPESLMKSADDTNVQNKGLKNIFVGLGLFIFLWAITTQFAIGSIGLLIMFIGFGQLAVYYANKDKGDRNR